MYPAIARIIDAALWVTAGLPKFRRQSQKNDVTEFYQDTEHPAVATGIITTMRKIFRTTDILTVVCLVAVACAMRILLFSGFVLGDDPAYADYVSRILREGYPRIGPHAVFACRPIMLYAIALPIYLFGWQEWSFVLPVLIASLINTVLVYWAGKRMGGYPAGVLAAVAYMTFPLDAVHATTLSNDILLSTFVWGGVCLLFAAGERRGGSSVALSGLAGCITGAAVAVKINALIAPVVLMPVLLYAFIKKRGRDGYKPPCVWLAGWCCAQILLSLFLYTKSGDLFAHYHAEMRFNLDFNPSGFSGSGLTGFLLYYPKFIIGMLHEGHQGYHVLPYGYFFLYFLLCLPLLPLRRFHAIRLPALCGLLYLLVMEFMPLRLSPAYVPIHRLPRFLHIAALPAAVTIGIAFSTIFAMQSRVLKLAAACALLFLLGSSCYWAYHKAAFYKDCTYDQRWVWEVARGTAAKKIITDSEMRNYLMFRSGFEPSVPILYPNRLPAVIPARSLVITGGARRPDMLPGFALDWYRNRSLDKELLIAEAPFPVRPWRLATLKIYYTAAETDSGRGTALPAKDVLHSNQHLTLLPKQKRIAELDVGSTVSERNHEYRFTESTWSGTREFTYLSGVSCTDDGRAHRGSEKFTVRNLTPRKPLTVLKRCDPGVANQVVDVYFNSTYIGRWQVTRQGVPGHWHESRFTLPARAVTGTSGVLQFRLVASDFDSNSFYYWLYQPE